MDHRTALASLRNVAHRTGSTAGRAALTAARGVGRRVAQGVAQGVAERRSARSGRPPGGRAPDVRARPAEATPPQPASARQRATPTPADVARAVARNAAGLARTNPGLARERAPRRSGPGAKLPARSGHGVLGV